MYAKRRSLSLAGRRDTPPRIFADYPDLRESDPERRLGHDDIEEAGAAMAPYVFVVFEPWSYAEADAIRKGLSKHVELDTVAIPMVFEYLQQAGRMQGASRRLGPRTIPDVAPPLRNPRTSLLMPTPTSQPLFTLLPDRWYAMQFVGGGFTPGARTAFSPILVHAVIPRKSGQGLVALDFRHANYPMGVQEKRYELRVRVREQGFLFAARVDSAPRLHLIVTELTWEWLETCFGITPRDPREDVQEARWAGCF